MSTSSQVKLEPGWKAALLPEFEQPYFQALKQFLIAEKQQGQTVYPPGSRIFAAFDETPLEQVKVVIIGQDPYHGPGQANGLCFSVSPGIKPPPSLVNIFKEQESDLELPIPNTGDLSAWAKQGVLLLNATLTVRARQPGSHQKKGWETFTDQVIRILSEQKSNLVFLLWGKFAQSKAELLDQNKHHILKAPHPSPYSASYGFFGCKHFSQANQLLEQHGLTPIDWRITSP